MENRRTDFDRLLEDSKKGENIVRDFFEKSGYEVQDISNDIKSGADLIITKGNFRKKVEVKYDSLAHKTGNIVVECVRLNDGIKGWTLTTQADIIVWVCKDTGEKWLIDRDTLQKATATLYKPQFYHIYKSLLTGKKHIESNFVALKSMVKSRKKLKTEDTALGFLTLKEDPTQGAELNDYYIIGVLKFREILRQYKAEKPENFFIFK